MDKVASKGIQDGINKNYNAGNFITAGLNAEPNEDPNSCYNKYFFWLQTRWWQVTFSRPQ